MSKSISIIGSGINGLLTAFYISNSDPEISITIYEADSHPANESGQKGTTLGSKDARHITGSESICFESSVHHQALRNYPSSIQPGWLLKDESKLSSNELMWRDKFEKLYTHNKGVTELDYAHAELNYKGLKAWHDLASKYPKIERHFLTQDVVRVYFESRSSLLDDFKMECDFSDRYYPIQKVIQSGGLDILNTYKSHLLVPGMSVQIKSLALELIDILERSPKVNFHWNTVIEDSTRLDTDAIIWTAGATHQQPLEYKEMYIQGIVGCWATVKNPGFTKPFKIAAPIPSAYMNLTPDGDTLHISGGFGWVGATTDKSEVEQLAKPVARHLIEQIHKFLDIDVSIEEIEYCIRPSTPSGLPLMKTVVKDSKKHIYISGSSKSGTTHAPILSEYVLDQF